VIIGEGEGNFWDMVRDMKEGLVVELVMGAEQGNVLNGDFSGNVLLGYKVESGEIVGRVKNTMISGNVYQILSQLEGIGRERRWVEGMLLTPCLYCRSLPVATKES
jgi:PmbA protein